MSTSTTKRFTTTIARSGKSAYVAIPFDPGASWGAKDRYYVKGSIDGCRIRGVLLSDGRQFVLPLGPAWRRDNDVDTAGKVEVVLTPDGPQSEGLAPDVAAALDAEPDAETFFQSIAPFYRKNFIRWIESAKRQETRAARIDEMIRLLRDRKRQK